MCCFCERALQFRRRHVTLASTDRQPSLPSRAMSHPVLGARRVAARESATARRQRVLVVETAMSDETNPSDTPPPNGAPSNGAPTNGAGGNGSSTPAARRTAVRSGLAERRNPVLVRVGEVLSS